MEDTREIWQRGPLKNMPALLQPVAHALLQAKEEVQTIMNGFPEALLWEKPAGVTSPAFHLQHLAGVLNRLFTYAKNESLTSEQLNLLRIEGNKTETKLSAQELVELFNQQVETCINELQQVNTNTLTDARTVGRKQIPTTLIGLYVHAAEHTMRHTGQLLVTVRVLKEKAL